MIQKQSAALPITQPALGIIMVSEQ
ncbi:unnamed protein product, partial [Allacma fusca]